VAGPCTDRGPALVCPPLVTPARSAVITGSGVVSPLGNGLPAFWEGLVAGRSAIAPIRRFQADDLDPATAAEIAGDGAGDADRAGAFALTAALEALASAHLRTAELDPARVAVALGTTLGGMEIFETWDRAAAAECAPPAHLERVPYFAPAARVAAAVRARGPVVTTQLACASGTQAVALAAEWVRAGRADVVLAGGSDLLCRFVVSGFNSLRATADVARPFDRDRRGLVLGEGAAVLVIEEEAHAARRGARVAARVLGTGAAGDAVHMTAPDREGGGVVRAVGAALADAAVPPSAVDFVSAHGTGTPFNDAMEARALLRLFGAYAVPVNSIKGAIGHTLGAAGAFEAVLCAEVVARGLVPPTAGLQQIDPECAGLDLVHGEARRCDVRVALSTSSGFAGANAAVVLGRA
jgi:3-oxoacyl-(acyl-carrier-protein) synthase